MLSEGKADSLVLQLLSLVFHNWILCRSYRHKSANQDAQDGEQSGERNKSVAGEYL